MIVVLTSALLAAAVAGDPAPGITESLATARAARIADLRYELSFDLPADAAAPIAGRETVRFALANRADDLVLDFDPGQTAAVHVRANGRDSRVRLVNGHIVVPAADLVDGANAIEIAFTAGNASLNRNPDFLYTLFVPARAHLAFPCFDQPSLKARYTLALTLPGDWQVVANGAETGRAPHGSGYRVTFAETRPLPTYLFAFAAGKFSIEIARRDG